MHASLLSSVSCRAAGVDKPSRLPLARERRDRQVSGCGRIGECLPSGSPIVIILFFQGCAVGFLLSDGNE